MHHRLICGILAALMPLLLAAPAFAQDTATTPAVFCGDLSEEDCAILQASATAMQDLKSYSFSVNGDFSFGGFPDMPADPLQVGITMDARFALDDQAQQAMQEMRKLQGADSQAMFKALNEQLPQFMIDFYSGVDFDASVGYSIPSEVAKLMSGDFPMPETLTVDMRMVDGTMYVNMAPFRALDPQLDRQLKSEWIGVDYVGLLKQQFDRQASMTGNALTTSVGSAAATVELMQQMEKHVTIERGKDVEVDGQQAAVFTYTPDLIGFFTSKDFQNALRTLASMAEDGSTKTEMEQGITMFSFMAPMIFRDLKIEGTTTIGRDDKMQHAASFTLDWDLAGLMQLAAMNDPSMSESMKGLQPRINLTFDGTVTDFNQDMNIEAPEDVEMIPLDQMTPQEDLSGIS